MTEYIPDRPTAQFKETEKQFANHPAMETNPSLSLQSSEELDKYDVGTLKQRGKLFSTVSKGDRWCHVE